MPLGHFAWKAGSHFSRYEIIGRLSAGGIAEVWRARVLGVESFQKDIVIKTMRPELADTPDLVRMFINEAEIAARMNHPGMCRSSISASTRGAISSRWSTCPGGRSASSGDRFA